MEETDREGGGKKGLRGKRRTRRRKRTMGIGAGQGRGVAKWNKRNDTRHIEKEEER